MVPNSRLPVLAALSVSRPNEGTCTESDNVNVISDVVDEMLMKDISSSLDELEAKSTLDELSSFIISFSRQERLSSS